MEIYILKCVKLNKSEMVLHISNITVSIHSFKSTHTLMYTPGPIRDIMIIITYSKQQEYGILFQQRLILMMFSSYVRAGTHTQY